MRKTRKKAGRKSRPLVEIRKPVRVRAYRGKFRAFESTRYLDAKALRSARSATIECGTVEAAGIRQTVAAVIRDGKIVALKPIACEGCEPPKGRSRRTVAQLKATMREVGERLAAKGLEKPMKPLAIRISRRAGLQIPFGPIVIVIGEPPIGIDVCIEWWEGNKFCWRCLLGPSGCITFGGPL